MKYVKYEDKKLIADKVKDFVVNGKRLYILKKNGDLYSRGSME